MRVKCKAAKKTGFPARGNWRRDLNCQSCSGVRSCVNSPRTWDHRRSRFELFPKREKSCPDNEKAIRRFGRRVFFGRNSGRLDTVRTFSGWRPGLGAWPAAERNIKFRLIFHSHRPRPARPKKGLQHQNFLRENLLTSYIARYIVRYVLRCFNDPFLEAIYVFRCFNVPF